MVSPTETPVVPPTDAPNCNDVGSFIIKKKGVETSHTCATYLKKKGKRMKRCQNIRGIVEGKKKFISELCPSLCDLKCKCKNWPVSKFIIPSLDENKKKWCKKPSFINDVCKDGNEEYCPKLCNICYNSV